MRNLLVVSEVALALMLLIGAGLLMRSLSGLRAVDPGFDPQQRARPRTIDIPEAKYPTPEQRNQFFDRVAAKHPRAARRGVGGVDRHVAAAGRVHAVRRRRRPCRR